MLDYMAMLRIAAYTVLVILLPSGSGFVAAQTGLEIPGSGPVKSTGTLNSSLLVIIFIFGTPMILIGFSVIFVLWWRRGEAEISRPSLNVLQPRPASAARAIEALPVIIYADIKSLVAGKGALECAVCLSEFGDREKLRLLPKCDHVFHIQCIGAWLCDHVTCPVCRSDLAAEPVVERRTGSDY